MFPINEKRLLLVSILRHFQRGKIICLVLTGGRTLYGLYSFVRPQRVWFFSRFGRKLGIDFSHFAAILVINRVSMFAL